jgi:WD40 repeat protein
MLMALIENQILGRHDGIVNSVAFSTDGSLCVSAGEDKVAKVWDVATRTLRWTLKGHGARVNDVAASPDSQFFYTASHDRTVRKWLAFDGSCVGKFRKRFGGHRSAILGVAPSTCTRFVLTAGEDGTVRVWGNDFCKHLFVLKQHVADVHCIAASPDHKHFITGDAFGWLVLWRMDWSGHGSGKVEASFAAHDAGGGGVFSVAFSPDGKCFASGGWGKVKMWSVAQREELWSFEGHTGRVFATCFSPNGARVISASDNDGIRVLDANNGLELNYISNVGEPLAAAVSPDGVHVAAGNRAGVVHLLRLG